MKISEDSKKYNSKNYIAKKLLSGFFNSIENQLTTINFQSVCEAGCGEGYVTEFVHNINKAKAVNIVAFDIEEEKIAVAQKRNINVDFQINSIYDTGFADNSFDLIMATEVLEHLEDPKKALAEMLRISKKYIFVSVPNEPIWRILNMLRGKYLRDFGNSNGHINHWNSRTLSRLLNSQNIKILKISQPLPWIMFLCEKQ